jgi:alpha-glucosidase
MKGKVWPGECNFPDYTNPEVREWWAGLFKELISDIGVKGVWNMNEPAVMEVPIKRSMDVRHDYDGNPCSHRKAHNIYGTQMARATYHGVKDLLIRKDLYHHEICLCRSATLPS